MGALANLSSSTVTAAPGGLVSVELNVRNTGSVVDAFSISVVGEAASWTHVEPPSLSLFPGAEGTVTVTFEPPRAASLRAGEVPFGVRVASREDSSQSTVEEGTLLIGAFFDVAAELVPRTSRGRRGARHTLAIDNRGNQPVAATVAALDPDGLLLVNATPAAVDLAPGTATFVTVRVRPRRRIMRGVPQTRRFSAAVEGQGMPPVGVDGTFVQEPVLPPWILRALAAVVLLGVALVALWFAVLRPTVRSEAQKAAKAETASSAGPGSIGGSNAGTKAGSGGPTSSGGGGVVTSGGTAPGTGAGTGRPGAPIDGRLFLTGPGVSAYEVPTGKQLELTDIVFENPGGNAGPMQLQRSGTPLLVLSLENFRDLDYHFVSPIVFTAGKKLELAAQCTTPTCTPSAYFSGTLADAP